MKRRLSGVAATSAVYRAAMSLSVSLCRSVQWIPPFWSKVLSACRNSPSCILPKAAFCSASLTRCTSFKVAAPWVCRNVSNMPPRSMLESCLSSPARMSFAPASRAAAATRASSFVEIIAASSTIKTVSRFQLVRPFSSAFISLARVFACRKPSPRICCATSFVQARPRTSLPANS